MPASLRSALRGARCDVCHDRIERSPGRHAGGAVGPEQRSEERSEYNDRIGRRRACWSVGGRPCYPGSVTVPSRRDLLKLGLGTAAWLAGSGLGCSPKRRAEVVHTTPHPRYWVL